MAFFQGEGWTAGKARSQTDAPIQELSVSGGQLDKGEADRGNGEQHQGELFPRVGFIETNMNLPPRSVVRCDVHDLGGH